MHKIDRQVSEVQGVAGIELFGKSWIFKIIWVELSNVTDTELGWSAFI